MQMCLLDKIQSDTTQILSYILTLIFSYPKTALVSKDIFLLLYLKQLYNTGYEFQFIAIKSTRI